MALILLLLPDTPHYWEYTTAIEQACLKLEPHNAEELRATMRGGPEEFTRTHKKHHQTRGPGTCGAQE